MIEILQGKQIGRGDGDQWSRNMGWGDSSEEVVPVAQAQGLEFGFPVSELKSYTHTYTDMYKNRNTYIKKQGT